MSKRSDNQRVRDFNDIVDFLLNNWLAESNEDIYTKLGMTKGRFYGLKNGKGYKFSEKDVINFRRTFGEPFSDFWDGRKKQESNLGDSDKDKESEQKDESDPTKYLIKHIEIMNNVLKLHRKIEDKIKNLSEDEAKELEDILNDVKDIEKGF